jgi:hypothetical protein
LKDDLSRHQISRRDQSAFRANMLSIRKKFANCCATKTTLAGSRWMNLDQIAAGALSLVRDLMEEGRPADILHGFGEPT